MARADAIEEFKASQPFIDACAVYYSDRFEDCLKLVGSIYPNLDLSKVTMDDSMPTTLAFSDDNSTHTEQDPKDDGVVLAQPAFEKLVTPLVSFVKDPSAYDALNFVAQDAPNSSAQDTQNPTA